MHYVCFLHKLIDNDIKWFDKVFKEFYLGLTINSRLVITVSFYLNTEVIQMINSQFIITEVQAEMFSI